MLTRPGRRRRRVDRRTTCRQPEHARRDLAGSWDGTGADGHQGPGCAAVDERDWRSRFSLGDAPAATFGEYPRLFTFGHVRQPLDAVAAGLLARLAAATPVLPDAHKVVFVDLDDTERQTYGFAKQGAGRGYTGVNGLNALLAVISTPLSAPLIAATRLRRGSANSARGAAKLLADALATARRARAAGLVLVRADSAYYGHDIVAACRRAGARFSITARLTPRWSGRSPASMSRPGYRSGIRTRSTTRPSSGGSRRFR